MKGSLLTIRARLVRTGVGPIRFPSPAPTWQERLMECVLASWRNTVHFWHHTICRCLIVPRFPDVGERLAAPLSSTLDVRVHFNGPARPIYYPKGDRAVWRVVDASTRPLFPTRPSWKWLMLWSHHPIVVASLQGTDNDHPPANPFPCAL